MPSSREHCPRGLGYVGEEQTVFVILAPKLTLPEGKAKGSADKLPYFCFESVRAFLVSPPNSIAPQSKHMYARIGISAVWYVMIRGFAGRKYSRPVD
jgi:hypothetical protein